MPGRRPLIIAAGAVVLAAGSSAAAYANARQSQPATERPGTERPATEKSVARCYSVASLSAGPESFTTLAEASGAGNPGQAEAREALSFCASLWLQGMLHSGPQGAGGPQDTGARGPAASDPPGARTVPPLATCVLPDGTAAVFPGSRSVCAALGLPDAAG